MNNDGKKVVKTQNDFNEVQVAVFWQRQKGRSSRYMCDIDGVKGDREGSPTFDVTCV